MDERLLPITELLAGLAEECGELTQAALKLRRVYDGTNPTPVSEEEAVECVHEEVADVLLYIDELGLNVKHIAEIKRIKRERWVNRMEEQTKA